MDEGSWTKAVHVDLLVLVFAIRIVKRLSSLSSRRRRARGNETLSFFETQLVIELAPEQEQVDARLQSLRSHREIPDVPNIETRRARHQHRRQREEQQPARRTEQWRQRVAEPLEHAR